MTAAANPTLAELPIPQSSDTSEADLINAAEALRAHGHLSAAEQALNLLINSQPNSIAGNLALGLHLLECNSAERACRPLERALTLSEAQPNGDGRDLTHPILVALGAAYRDAGHFRNAVHAFRRAHANQSGTPSSLTGFGQALLAIGRYREAASVFRRALELDPSRLDAGLGLVQSLREMRCFDEAIDQCHQLIQADPKQPVAHAHLAECLRALSEFDKASEAADRALELAPDDPGVVLVWAQVKIDQKHQQIARQRIDQNLASHPDNLELRINSGLIWQRMGEDSKAEAEFTLVLQSDASNIRALGFRGESRLTLNDAKGSLADFDRLVKAAPDAPFSWAWRGQTAMALQDYEGALRDFTKALELDDEFTWAIAYRGEALRRMRRYDQAIAAFDRNLELCPLDAWTLAHRGATRRWSDLGLARQDLERALECKPAYPWAQGQLAWVLLEQGDSVSALCNFDQVLKASPRDHWTWYGRAAAFGPSGSHQQRTDCLVTAIAIASDERKRPRGRFRTLFNLGIYEVARGQLDNAQNAFAEAFRANPPHYILEAAEFDLRECDRWFHRHQEVQAIRNRFFVSASLVYPKNVVIKDQRGKSRSGQPIDAVANESG